MEINAHVFDHFPQLHTERLTLREILPIDAIAIFRMRANERINQFIARPLMDEEESAEVLVQRTRNAFVDKTAIGWAGVLRDSREIIGTCGFNAIDWQNLRAEIGGEMDVNYWGKGIAFEAVQAIVNFGFEEMNLHAIEAKIDPNNRGAHVVLKELNFIEEARYKDRIYFNQEFRDLAVYTCFNPTHNFERNGQ